MGSHQGSALWDHTRAMHCGQLQVALKHEVQEIRRVRGEMESLADTVAAHLTR